MLEATAVATAIPSLWSAFNSWFTPAVLFILLNVMIAIIALTSYFTPLSSHDIPPYPPPHQLQQQHDEGEEASKQSPFISFLDRLKSLAIFSSSPDKSSPQQRQRRRQQQPIPLIPPEELYSETHDFPKDDPFEKQGFGQKGSPSPVGKFEAFDLYGYLPREPTSEIPLQSNPAHYIFEPTHPQEVLFPAEQNDKVEEEEEEEEEVEEEDEVEDGSEEEMETEREVPGLLLRRGIGRSESLNVKLSFSNDREEEGKERGLKADKGEVTESVEKRRPVTVREGKGKWGGDEEVDARADDFINRFKQQLKLQRMDSMAKQKDVTMISKVRSF